MLPLEADGLHYGPDLFFPLAATELQLVADLVGRLAR